MSMDAVNRKALEDYKAEWGRRAVASGMINPAFYPTYQSVLSKPIPTITDKTTFDKAASDIAQAIKVWYVNAKYRGNLMQLANEIDAKKPAYNESVAPLAPEPAPAPAPVSSRSYTNDANMKALEDYKAEWGRRAVASGMINPAFYPTYQSILSKPIPTITDKTTFDKVANELAQTIKVWYVNAKYSGNLTQLANEIDATKPTYNGVIPPPAPAPEPAPVARAPAPAPPAAEPSYTNADCLTNGSLTTAMNNYQKTCANTPQVNEVRNKFFTTEPNASVNFLKEFETLQALSQADIQDIQGLLSGATKSEIFLKITEKLEAQKTQLEASVSNKRAKADAANQQFLDARTSTGEVKKSKVNVLQDYILAAFSISWIFLIVVLIIYITRTSETPIRSLISGGVLSIIVTAILYTWVTAIA